eukprot:4834251-Amphidinium_carterae.2
MAFRSVGLHCNNPLSSKNQMFQMLQQAQSCHSTGFESSHCSCDCNQVEYGMAKAETARYGMAKRS